MSPVQSTIEALRAAVSSNLQQCVWRPVDERALRGVCDTVSGLLERHGVVAVRALPAWAYMTTWQKCKWLLVNRLIPSVGREIRTWHSVASSQQDDSTQSCSRDLPHWCLEDPHSTVVVDALFTPTPPASYIEATIQL